MYFFYLFIITMTTTSAANTIIPARIDYIRLPPNEWTAPSDVYVTTKLVDHSVVSLRFLSQKSTAQRKRQHKNICAKDRNRSKRRLSFHQVFAAAAKIFLLSDVDSFICLVWRLRVFKISIDLKCFNTISCWCFQVELLSTVATRDHRKIS